MKRNIERFEKLIGEGEFFEVSIHGTHERQRSVLIGLSDDYNGCQSIISSKDQLDAIIKALLKHRKHLNE